MSTTLKSLKGKSANFLKRTKTKVKNFKTAVSQAYDIGYKSGYSDATKIGSTYSSRKSATLGYGKGLSNHHKVKRYQARYEK